MILHTTLPLKDFGRSPCASASIYNLAVQNKAENISRLYGGKMSATAFLRYQWDYERRGHWITRIGRCGTSSRRGFNAMNEHVQLFTHVVVGNGGTPPRI
jgi:hypothetical protein